MLDMLEAEPKLISGQYSWPGDIHSRVDALVASLLAKKCY